MRGRFATRAHAVEHLDAPTLDAKVLREALRQIAGVNRWLGGARAVLKHLTPVLEGTSVLSVLDVGTGAADIPIRIARGAASRGQRVSVVAMDSHPQVARFARAACAGQCDVSVAVGDGQRLPLRTGSVDVAISSLTLHHLTDEASVMFVREMARVARRAIILNDLERHPLNYLGARALASTLWRRNRYTRDDGPLSVLRSFRANEMLRIGETAGLDSPAVFRSFPYRLVMVGRPNGRSQ